MRDREQVQVDRGIEETRSRTMMWGSGKAAVAISTAALSTEHLTGAGAACSVCLEGTP
jgi:hypothetical protein